MSNELVERLRKAKSRAENLVRDTRPLQRTVEQVDDATRR